MTNKYFIIIFTLLLAASCKDDPIGPEMDCDLDNLYVQTDHEVEASKAFDIRNNPPTDLGKALGYKLNNQLLFNHEFQMLYPYSEYFIDTIKFLDQATVWIHFFETDTSKVYTYTRDDCSLDLTSPDGDLHLELTHGGDEVTEHRFAIFDHHSKWITLNTEQVRLDTFEFIEYRLGAFSTYEEIIKQFAIDHPGMYDTVALELIQNKTRE